MRKRTLSAATALAVLFSSAALVAGTASQAAADSSKVLPVSSVGDMVVDGVHQKIFISDPSGGKLVVTDYAGTVLATVPDLPGVRGLEIAADSSRVYATVSGNDTIVSVNTETPSEVVSYALGADMPGDLALAGGKLWFAYADAQIGSLDVSGAEPVVALAQAGGIDWHPAAVLLLGSDPSAPNVLAIGDRDSSPSTLGVYDVTTGTPELKVSKRGEYGSLQELDVTPDGQNVITSSGSPYYHPAFSTTDLSEATRYNSNTYPNSVAIAPDGTIAGGTFSWYDPDVHVFKPGMAEPVRTYDFPNTGSSSGADTLDAGALAWAPDSSKLFAVSNNTAGVRTLRVYDGPTKSAPTITVKAPATANRAQPLTVSGTVTASVPLPAGTPLTVTRYDVEAPQGKALGTKTLGANGAFSFTDTPTAGGAVTYKVAYAGSDTHTAASGTARVEVSRNKATLTLDRNGLNVDFNTSVWYTATLGPTYKNREVEIWADPFGPEPKRLLRRGTVNSEGKLAVQLKMTRDTRVGAWFAGDSRTASAIAWSNVYTRAGLATKMSRHYKWTKIGNTWYRTYHQTADPLIAAWHNSYPNRSTRLDLQIWYGGAWQHVASDYFQLNPNGVAYVSVDGDGAAGYRFRVRSSYIDGAAGDSVNTTAYGQWQYFNFTR
ncbi:Ig-like domain repeat protein [Streptomyces sp. NPDC003035]|uniref:Ig-like domain repeat protein n=1 Tax=Streptomyces sp. NPDC003035 TaxID=3364676 RepID=UPI0036817815